MTDDSEVLGRVRQAFATVVRPEHFTDHTHYDECHEHDETLRARDLDTLSFDDMGNGAWDPITMATPVAFAYYLPALARIALDEPHPTWGWFGPQLSWQLERDERRNERWLACNEAQRAAVAALLEHIIDTRASLIAEYDCANELLRTHEIWSE